jgi:DNA-binding response OmpR family regulator
MPTAAAKVLICDEADGFRHRLQELFLEAGVDVVTCSRWDDVAGTAERERPDAIVADLLTPTFDVEELVRVRKAAPDALLAVVTAAHHEDERTGGERTGGIDLVLSRRDPPQAIAAAVLERL